MTQDDYSSTLTPMNSHMWPGLMPRRPRISPLGRHLLFAIGLALLLTCIEGILWIINPSHLLGNGSSHTIAGFFALPAHQPMLLLVPLGEVALSFWLISILALPMACMAYLKAVYLAQERYRERSTPLQSWSNPYPVPLVYYQDDPDPTRPRQARPLSTSELAEKIMAESTGHMILLGSVGSGKTMFAHEFLSLAARRSRDHAFGGLRLPVFLPLKYYTFFCQKMAQNDLSLLDFLTTLEGPGMEHIRPYLNTLFQRGRLLFLCDGLDEVSDVYRPALDQELALFFHQNRNGLLLTCSQTVYEQTPGLVRSIGENLIPRAAFSPLKLVDMRRITERYIKELDSSYDTHLPTVGQIMTLIEHTRLRLLCATPLYLFAFLADVATLPMGEIRRLDNRGRLLRAFLLNRLPGAARDDEELPDELAFLADLASSARWNGNSELVFLPGGGFLALDVDASTHSHVPSEEQLDALAFWSREQQIMFPFARDEVFLLAEMIDPERAATSLLKAQNASLVEINEQGILVFCHALVTSALVAEYFARFLGASALHLEAIELLPEDLIPWCEPLALWAGLLEEPQEACAYLANYALAHPEQAPSALLISLICLGVAAIPPEVDSSQMLALPPALVDAFSMLLNNVSGLEALAKLFMRCATSGAPELYQALFPLLAVAGVEAFLVLLDATIVSDLFFSRLITVIDEADQEALVKQLVRALSVWAAAVVPRAANLAVSNSGGRLRTAAINVLGGTRDKSAVEPLMVCLRSPDQFIVGRAANALNRLGPSLTLQRLIAEVETPVTASGRQSLHWIILPIFERFLNETRAARQLNPEQVERVIAALMRIQATHTDLADLEKVREILVSQSRMAAERDSGKIALNFMVQSLATTNDTVARHTTGALKEVGQVATPHLLEQLEHQPSEPERVRILEILASVRDLRALTSLLRMLEDTSLAVQQALAV
ncbi:MAG TPA: NACHT domain-containing protein, partial [Ktedonobacteraceae bacterium]|nr:NACHT domain-containing protein [Ktedonobacteraceae bacterium]